jgi:3-deoxy-manno-octulosonate cytidylyltransferase (CMP-KDO synthetase)
MLLLLRKHFRQLEAAKILSQERIVNVQGDEPLLDPTHIDALIDGLLEDGEALVSNAACPLERTDVDNPNVVKAVAGKDRYLLYLSRSPIPFSWDGGQNRLRHLGMYAFREDALSRFASRTSGPLEQAERVEMFRYLEHGDPIVLVTVPPTAPAVDVPEDLSRLEAFAQANGGWPPIPGGKVSL